MCSASGSNAALVTLPTPGTPPTTGLHLQRGTSPDGLGLPDPQLQLTFFQEHRDSLRQEVAFQNLLKRWKEKRHLLLHFVSSTDGDSLTVISSDTREPGENIKAGLSSQREPLPDTEIPLPVCLWSFFFFFFLPKEEVFYSTLRKNLTTGVLLLIWWDSMSRS